MELRSKTTSCIPQLISVTFHHMHDIISSLSCSGCVSVFVCLHTSAEELAASSDIKTTCLCSSALMNTLLV